MNQTDFRTYKKLKEDSFLTEKAIPKTVLSSTHFEGLVSSLIIEKTRSGRGFRYKINKPTEFDNFFRAYFPEDIEIKNKSDNVRKFRNSKIQKTVSTPIFMLRGFETIRINGNEVNLEDYTSKFQIFACNAERIEAKHICIVENLDTFLVAEKLLGKSFVFLHKYGRIGKESLNCLFTKHLLVFVDYDFNGLEEFLRIKEVFDFAQLHIPENYDELFSKYSQSLKGNKAEMTNRIKQSSDINVIRIRESIIRNNRFLEQQYWKYD
ncbi:MULTISPECIES: hypothetical protein [Bacteroidota]|uniref:hypothetical protein n=1 Tax=Flavobacterium sp. TaxID=239 RepID=UPI004047117B